MTKAQAILIKEKALNAITELNRVLLIDKEYPEYEQIKKGVGISMGFIDDSILQIVYKVFPELDHIK